MNFFMKSKEINKIWLALSCNKCKTVTQTQLRCNATISLPISININIRGPNWGLILIILGAQGGGAKIKKLFEKKSQSSLTS